MLQGDLVDQLLEAGHADQPVEVASAHDLRVREGGSAHIEPARRRAHAPVDGGTDFRGMFFGCPEDGKPASGPLRPSTRDSGSPPLRHESLPAGALGAPRKSWACVTELGGCRVSTSPSTLHDVGEVSGATETTRQSGTFSDNTSQLRPLLLTRSGRDAVPSPRGADEQKDDLPYRDRRARRFAANLVPVDHMRGASSARGLSYVKPVLIGASPGRLRSSRDNSIGVDLEIAPALGPIRNIKSR